MGPVMTTPTAEELEEQVLGMGRAQMPGSAPAGTGGAGGAAEVRNASDSDEVMAGGFRSTG